jgi:hypothetical protein
MHRIIITAVVLLALAMPATAQQASHHFVHSERCMACHNGLVTAQGVDVSIGHDWGSSIMAHSAIDPYWRGSIRRETMDFPEAAAEIQNECTRCHMPISQRVAETKGQPGQAFAHFNPAQPTPLDQLALDGVNCTTCHQIEPQGLGTQETFVGDWRFDTATPLGTRPAYGPYEVKTGHKALMSSAALLEPNQGEHIQSSGLCGSCHTLYTHTRGDDGEIIGTLPEQMPYLEWRHSDYVDGGPRAKSCQQCHMPRLEQMQEITSVLGEPRENVNRHLFRGGNFLGFAILQVFRDEIGVTTPLAELEQAQQATRDNLKANSARVEISELSRSGDTLTARIRIENLTGHKLPTAYPSRRVWLHVILRDADGAMVFESGALRDDGSIVGNDNDRDATRYEPHYATITDPGQVQIYEGILADPEDNVTTGLLTAIRYIKDNRLPPHGFDKTTAQYDIAVQGEAYDDPDFDAPGDTIDYVIDLAGARGPFTLEAELMYQPIQFRWARNLADYDADEPQRFVAMYDELSELSFIRLTQTRRTF